MEGERFIYAYAYAYTYMVKVISLSNEAYGKLKAIKGDRSFSEVVIEVTGPRKKRSIMDLAGAWSDMSDKEADEMKRNIENLRKSIGAGILRRHAG